MEVWSIKKKSLFNPYSRKANIIFTNMSYKPALPSINFLVTGTFFAAKTRLVEKKKALFLSMFFFQFLPLLLPSFLSKILSIQPRYIYSMSLS